MAQAPASKSLNPFFTRYFVPVPSPATRPTTRKIEVTYQGFYQTGDGPKHAIFKLAERFMVASDRGQDRHQFVRRRGHHAEPDIDESRPRRPICCS